MIVRALSLLLMTALLGACSSPPPERVPPLTFRKFQPFHMAVSSIEFVEEYKSPMRAPYVEHLMPISPMDAMRSWIRDRMIVAGGDKTMQVIVKEASVQETDLSRPLSMSTVFAGGEDAYYEAKLVVVMRIYGLEPMAEAEVEISATRNLTLAENASLSSRNEAFRKMINDLMATANAQLEKNIYQYMSPYIHFTHNP